MADGEAGAGLHDAALLAPLTEDTFLHNLHVRYKRDLIYVSVHSATDYIYTELPARGSRGARRDGGAGPGWIARSMDPRSGRPAKYCDFVFTIRRRHFYKCLTYSLRA